MKKGTRNTIIAGLTGIGLAKIIKKVDVKKPKSKHTELYKKYLRMQSKALNLSIANCEKSDEILKLEEENKKLKTQLNDKGVFIVD